MSTVRPTLYIDADACPGTAAALSNCRRMLNVVIAGNSTQNLEAISTWYRAPCRRILVTTLLMGRR